jgi:S-(hydroxymethyl)glutathione dehydrogenase/alcohol dehydrogenase
VEAAGRVQTIEQAFESTRKFGGQCVFASHPPAGQKISVDPHDLISGKCLKGTWGGASVPDRDVALFARMYLDGKLPLERLLSNRYDLEEINQAIDDLGSGSAFRPLIRL